MKKPKLYNKPNACVRAGGKEYWISRSVAVMAVVLISQGESTFVLMNKRGKGAPDFRGCWCCPCGYLDWSESSWEAVIREIWEESGFNVEAFKETKGVETLYLREQPWWVDSDPHRRRKSYRQNVTLRFGAMFRIPEGMEFPRLTREFSEENEVDGLSWIKLPLSDHIKYAFDHNRLVREFLIHVGDIYEQKQTRWNVNWDGIVTPNSIVQEGV